MSRYLRDMRQRPIILISAPCHYSWSHIPNLTQRILRRVRAYRRSPFLAPCDLTPPFYRIGNES